MSDKAPFTRGRRKDGKPYKSGNIRQDGEYAVGKSRPPKAGQFAVNDGRKRGRRPRGTRGLKTDLLAALSARQTIQINGEKVRGTRQEQMLRTLATRAAAGDLKAQALLIPLILQALGIEDHGDHRERLSAHDQTLLDKLLAPDPPQPPALPDQTADADSGDVTSLPANGPETHDG